MKVNNITRLLVACIWCMCTFLVAAEATTKVTPPQEAIEHREALKLELQQKALLEVEQKALEQALIEKNALMQQQETEGAIFQIDPQKAASYNAQKVAQYKANMELQRKADLHLFQ